MLKRYFKLWIIVFWYNEVCNIKDNCHECLNYTFCPRKWSGALQQTHIWRLIISYFDDYQGSVWFLLILKSSTHKTIWCPVKTTGDGTNCPDIKDKWATSFWVEYVKITHIWLTIRKQGEPLEGLWSNTSWIQPGYKCLSIQYPTRQFPHLILKAFSIQNRKELWHFNIDPSIVF